MAETETIYPEDLSVYHGDDPRGEYYCPDCGGVMYCVDETPSGDAVYECQKCLKNIKVGL